MKKNLASSFSSRWMRWGGLTILLFLIWHLIEFTIPKVNIDGGATNDPYNLLVDTFDIWWMTLIYLAAMFALGMHLHHGTWSAAQTLGLTNNAQRPPQREDPRLDPRRASSPAASPSSRSSSSPASSTKGSPHMTDMPDTTLTSDPSHDAPGEPRRRRRRLLHARRADPRHQGPRGADRRALADPQVRGPPGQPVEPAQARRDHRRHRPGRRRRRRHARRGRLQREVLLLPGLPAPGALDRRAGRHQRGQELQGGRRLRPPAVLRHRQGRRLPLARVERLPPGRGQHEHHRPVRRAGRPVRP